MKLIKATPYAIDLTVTVQELQTITNALNEVCNGIDIPEFATRIGAEPEAVQVLLQSINAVLKRAETAETK